MTTTTTTRDQDQITQEDDASAPEHDDGTVDLQHVLRDAQDHLRALEAEQRNLPGQLRAAVARHDLERITALKGRAGELGDAIRLQRVDVARVGVEIAAEEAAIAQRQYEMAHQAGQDAMESMRKAETVYQEAQRQYRAVLSRGQLAASQRDETRRMQSEAQQRLRGLEAAATEAIAGSPGSDQPIPARQRREIRITDAPRGAGALHPEE